jgi:LacI family transcriptional regulator
MRLTINDIARRAGVSSTTVSRVINHKPDVDDKTRENILKIIEETNYMPNPIMTGLGKHKTYLIGFFTYNLVGPFRVEILRGISERLSTSQYQLLFYNTNVPFPTTPEEFAKTSQVLFEIINKGSVDGLVMLQPVSNKNYLAELYANRFPLVFIDDWGYMSQFQVPRIEADNYNGALQAIRYLISLGHRRIGFITGPIEFGSSPVRSSVDRLAGYKEALNEAGLPFDNSLVCHGNFSEESGYSCIKTLLDRDEAAPGFTALFASSDLMAIGAMNALNERGLRVPDDISVVGFDDIPLDAYVRPALTTVRMPVKEMGERAVEMLIEQIEGKTLTAKKVLFPTELIIRASTRYR